MKNLFGMFTMEKGNRLKYYTINIKDFRIFYLQIDLNILWEVCNRLMDSTMEYSFSRFLLYLYIILAEHPYKKTMRGWFESLCLRRILSARFKSGTISVKSIDISMVESKENYKK